LRDGETVGTVEVSKTTPEDLVLMMVPRGPGAGGRGPGAGKREPGKTAPLLSVSGLSSRKLRDVSFELHAGEVLGIAGLVGAGRSELGAALFGMNRATGGEIRLRGASVEIRSPAAAMRHGIGLLPEDRKLQGLMMDMSVLENGAMASLRRMSRLGFLSAARERGALLPLYRQLALQCASFSAPVAWLSGGNQQKALLGRWLLVNPDVLFLDDPARGIDVGAKQDVYRMIAELAAAGKGVMLASSELPELLRCADRILVLKDGRVAATYTAAEATAERIMAASTGAAP